MKKTTFLIFFILAIFAAISVVLLFGFIRSLGPSDPAQLVPANTVAFACAPNLIQTALRWPRSSLAKIAQEPDVKDFLKDPISHFFQGDPGIGNQILAAKPRTIFLALTRLSPQGTHVLLGFQFLGSHQTANAALEFLRSKIIRTDAIASRSSVRYHSDTIDSVIYQNTTIYSAMHGRWGFISNDLPALQDALNRAARRNSGPSLKQHPDYLQTAAHLPKRPDLKIFINSKFALDALLAVGTSMGSIPDAVQVQQLQKLGSLTISSRFEGPNFRDTLAVILHNPPLINPLQHIAIKFTRPETLAYLEVAKQGFPLFEISLLANKLLECLADTQFSLQAFDQIFGSEAALFCSWSSTNFRPSANLVTEVRDRTPVISWLDRMGFKPLPPNLKWPNITSYQSKSSQSSLIVPTVAFKENLLLAGLTDLDVEETLSSEGSSITLENSPAFAPALQRYQSQNVLFAFINTKELFERVYALLRPVISFGAAMRPDIMQEFDISKLPSATSISKHLQPIVALQQLQGNVMVFDSTGPVTLDQALLVLLLVKMGLLSVPQP